MLLLSALALKIRNRIRCDFFASDTVPSLFCFNETALENHYASSHPHAGRYPCGSLVHNGVWYYGTYCLGPYSNTRWGDYMYNRPHLGPFVGFRISRDFGKTWEDCPHTPRESIFKECGLGGYPVR